MSDELHASYSRNLAAQQVQKGLLSLAKKRGINKPEIWQHNGEWAMRYTSAAGEVRQMSLGNVFAKARGVIMSLGATKKLALRRDPNKFRNLVVEYEKLTGKKAPSGTSLQAMTILVSKAKREAGYSLGSDEIKIQEHIIKEAKSTIQMVKDADNGKYAGDQKTQPTKWRTLRMQAKAAPAKIKKAEAKLKQLKGGLSLEDDGYDFGDDVQRVLNAINKVKSDSTVKWQSANTLKSAMKNLETSNADAAARNLGRAQLMMAKDPDFKSLAPKLSSIISKLKALSLSNTPLGRLNALSLSEVTYHAGWFMSKGKRLGKTEAEATLNIFQK